MWNPSIYQKCNQSPVNVAKYYMKKSSKLFIWNKNEKILDMGCGDGTVTLNCILPKLPINFKELIGVDKSSAMLSFASSTHKHPKVKYLELAVPSHGFRQFYQYFDHVFSFACLHWIPQTREAISTLASVLKPGGQALMTAPISCQYDVMLELYNTPKWQPYMREFQKEKTFPFQWHPDPVSYLSEHFMSENLKIKFCELKDIDNVYTKVAFENFSNIINPYIGNIPAEKKKEFCADYLEHLMNNPSIQYVIDSNQEGKIIWRYQILAAFVQKTE